MPFICCVCKREDTRGKTIFDSDGKSKAEYCLHCVPKVFRSGAQNAARDPFADGFTVQNVKDRLTGRPIEVHSLKELRQAERDNNFVLAAMSDDDISKPPQHEKWAGDIAAGYKKKFCRDESQYAPDKVAKARKQAGAVKGVGETLADRPNSHRRVGK